MDEENTMHMMLEVVDHCIRAIYVFTHIQHALYRVYKKKLNKFEVALNVAKRLKV